MYSLGNFTKLLKSSNKILIFTHQNADPDAICSAYAMQYLLKKFQKKVRIDIVTLEGVNKISKKVVELIPIKTTNIPVLKEVDFIIIIDTNNLQLLGKWGEVLKGTKIPIVIIDHHVTHPKMKRVASYSICDDNASSTCEIVFEIFNKMRIKYDKKVARALLIGIVCDTRHFILASSKTLVNVSELIKNGAKIEEAMRILQTPMSQSEIIARLKAIQRLDFKKIGDWLIANTKIGSYQASTARIVTYVGAHVAIVGGTRKQDVKISLRSTKDFFENTGIHLGRDIAIPIGELLEGVGGGHAMAAGINGTGEVDDVIKKCMDRLKSMIQ